LSTLTRLHHRLNLGNEFGQLMLQLSQFIATGAIARKSNYMPSLQMQKLVSPLKWS